MASTIDNPIINSPFAPPKCQFAFKDNAITANIVPGRRKSVDFIPVAKPKARGKQQASLDFDTDHTSEENRLINRLRETNITRRWLGYWQRPIPSPAACAPRPRQPPIISER